MGADSRLYFLNKKRGWSFIELRARIFFLSASPRRLFAVGEKVKSAPGECTAEFGAGVKEGGHWR